MTSEYDVFVLDGYATHLALPIALHDGQLIVCSRVLQRTDGQLSVRYKGTGRVSCAFYQFRAPFVNRRISMSQTSPEVVHGSTFVPDGALSPVDWRDRLFERFGERYDNLTGPEAERGFLGIKATIVSAGAAVLAATMFVGPVLGNIAGRFDPEGRADLEKARTSSVAKALVFNEEQQINVGTAYFEERFSATGVVYKINWGIPLPFGRTGPDVIPDFSVNKELNGVGKEKFSVPFEALKAVLDPVTGKTKITVDTQKVVVSSSWKDAPVVRDFVVKGGERVYEADSRRANLVKGFSEQFTHFSQDLFADTIKALNEQTTRAMRIKALSTFTQQCPAQMEFKLKAAINKALTENIRSTGQDKAKIGEINYTEGPFKWTEEPTPPIVQSAVDKTYEHDTNVTVNNNFTVDKITCDVSGITKEQ